MDDEHHHHQNGGGTWNKSGSSGYESQPHSDHSSLDKNSPPATKCLRNNGPPSSSSSSAAGPPPPPSSPSDRSSGSLQRTAAPWLSPIKEGVIDVHQYCIPRPVWPGRDDALRSHGYPAAGDLERIPRAKCCRHCARCRCRSNSDSSSSSGSRGKIGNGRDSYSGYSSAYGGTISTSSTGSTSAGGGVCDSSGGFCSDDAIPSSGTASVKSNLSPLTLDPRFDGGIEKALANNWNSVDLRLNQKTDNLHYVSTYDKPF